MRPDTIRELLRHRVFLVRETAKLKTKVRNLLSKLNLNCPHSDVFSDVAIQPLREKQPGMPQVFADKLDDFLKLGEIFTVVISETQMIIVEKAKGDEVVILLNTIPGIGQFSALLIKAEIGTITRFPDSKHLTSYCGLVPSTYSSGVKST